MKTRIDHKTEESLRHLGSMESAHTDSDDGEVRQRIAARAYELYRQRGGNDGHDLDDWLEAEQAIIGSEAKPENSSRSILS